MGYLIEIYLDKRHGQGNIETQIIKNAEINQYEIFHTNYEISGIRNTIHKNRYIMSFTFPDETKHIINYIRFIKKNPRIHIDTIAYDNCIFRLLYSSHNKISLNKIIKKIQEKSLYS